MQKKKTVIQLSRTAPGGGAKIILPPPPTLPIPSTSECLWKLLLQSTQA